MSQAKVVSQPNYWWGPAGGGAVGAVALAAVAVNDELRCKTIRMGSVLATAGMHGLVGLALFGTASLMTTSWIRNAGTERLNETGPFFGLMAKTVPLQWATVSGTAFLFGVSNLYFKHRKAPNGFSYAVRVARDSLFKGVAIPLWLVLSAFSVGGVMGGLKLGENFRAKV